MLTLEMRKVLLGTVKEDSEYKINYNNIVNYLNKKAIR